MRALPALVFAAAIVTSAALVACGPSGAQVRSQRITTAVANMQQRPGPRQAQDVADAVHTAYLAGDYKTQPQRLTMDGGNALRAIDVALPSAGIDAPTLVGWRALVLSDLGRSKEAVDEFRRSFAMAPNKLAGRNLVLIYGAANQPQLVGQTCAATVEILTSSDDKLDLIAMCRKNMNSLSNEGEMSWMSPELVTWYQAENASRMQAQIDQQNARAEQDRREQQVVRQTEQCAATCKEKGLRCQNRCDGDQVCDNRCVEINHACLDRCESEAYEKLGR